MILETRDALDGQLTREAAVAQVAQVDLNVVHPLTGPVFALLAMIDELHDEGSAGNRPYALCSVAVDLKVSQVLDVPNVLISAFLPLDVFDSVP